MTPAALNKPLTLPCGATLPNRIAKSAKGDPMSTPRIDMTIHPKVTAFFDPATNTISYVVQDPASAACAVVDSVMDIDYAAGRITHASADRIIAHIRDNGLTLDWIIETHVHADHLSAAPYIQNALGGRIGIGEKITVVQDVFGKIFNEGTEFQRDGSRAVVSRVSTASATWSQSCARRRTSSTQPDGMSCASPPSRTIMV